MITESDSYCLKFMSLWTAHESSKNEIIHNKGLKHKIKIRDQEYVEVNVVFIWDT